ncbi:MAG: pilus assembly protein TadG-related protein [Parcubacteria group bacterium]
MLPRLANFARDTSGAVAPLFAAGLIAFVGAGALAWDVSRGYAMRAELEAAVDAAALAGATQLDGQSDSITRATAAARGALVQNAKRMGDTYEANVVTSTDTIQYLTDLTSRTVTTNGAQAQFIEITLQPRSMGLVLGSLMGLGVLHGKAHAVAGYGSAICKVPPMMICNPQETSTSTAWDPAALIGHTLVLAPAPSTGAFAPGQFGFLTVNSLNSASLIRDGLARFPPKTECYGETATPAGGNIASADDWINTRFDLYVSSAGALQTRAAYAPAMNTMIGVKAMAGSSSCNPSGIASPSPDCSSTAALASGATGYPRDCGQTAATLAGSGVWNVQQYFNTNHPGINLATFVPAVPAGATVTGWAYYGPSGPAGTTSPTRYQVYKWELAILNGDILNPGAFGHNQADSTGTADFARPQCNKNGAQTDPDRRTISVVVMNCLADGVKAQHGGAVIGYVDLFLLGPIAKSPDPNNAAQDLFAEVIGETTDTSSVGEETRYYSVRLYE